MELTRNRLIGRYVGGGIALQFCAIMCAIFIITGITILITYPDSSIIANPYYLFIVNDVCMYGIGTIGLWHFVKRLPPKEPISAITLTPIQYIGIILGAYGTASVINVILEAFLTSIDRVVDVADMASTTDILSSIPLGLSIFLSVAVSPICEELIFRGLMLPRFCRGGERFGIICSSAAFAFFHGNITQGAYAFVIGIILAVVVRRTGKVQDSIIIHCCLNAISACVIAPISTVDGNIAVAVDTIIAIMGIAVPFMFDDLILNEAKILLKNDFDTPIWHASIVLDLVLYIGILYCFAGTILTL